jgi:hypothetical protein
LQGSYSATIRFKGCSAGKSSQYARNGRRWGPFATVRRMLVFSSVWAVMGVIEVLFTVVGHDSGGFAMIGVFFLVTAAMGFAASPDGTPMRRAWIAVRW